MNENTNIYTVNFNKKIEDPDIINRIIKYLSKNDKNYNYVRQKKKTKKKTSDSSETYTINFNEKIKDPNILNKIIQHICCDDPDYNEYITNRCKTDHSFNYKIDENTYTINFNEQIEDPDIIKKIIKHLSKNDPNYYYVKHKKINKDHKDYEKHKNYTNEYIKNRCKTDEEYHERVKSQNRKNVKKYYDSKN